MCVCVCVGVGQGVVNGQPNGFTSRVFLPRPMFRSSKLANRVSHKPFVPLPSLIIFYLPGRYRFAGQTGWRVLVQRKVVTE